MKGVLMHFVPEKSGRFVLAAMLAVASHSVDAAISQPTRLVVDSTNSLQWHTYMAGQDGITWVWPDGAASAKLTVSGKAGVRIMTYVRAESPSPSFAPAVPTTASSEDVVDLTLEFFGSADASGDPIAGKTLSATGIGIVRGVNGAMGDLRACADGDKVWSRVRDASAVLPVPVGTVSLMIGGESKALDNVPGWYLWSPIGVDMAKSLVLTTEAEVHDIVLKCGTFGAILIVR
jgi:hypothetical protein